jgi:2-oxoglutarate ferredoxin oxidoreductase subunit gamma
MREDLLLAGLGGQGVLFAGQLFAHAALRAGLEVCWFPSYTPEVRGGESVCTVVVADGPVGSPVVGRPHNLILMDPHAAANYLPRSAPGALAVINTSLVQLADYPQSVEILPVPALALAAQLGNERAANLVMLGAFLARKPVLKLEYVRRALEELMADHPLLPTNLRALQVGWQMHLPT